MKRTATVNEHRTVKICVQGATSFLELTQLTRDDDTDVNWASIRLYKVFMEDEKVGPEDQILWDTKEKNK